MAIELRYRSSRAEIWRWYWVRWRQSLWCVHLVLLAGLPAIVFAGQLLRGEAPSASGVVIATGPGLLACLLLVAYPQLAFKPRERWLKIGPDGIDTTIGRRAGHRNWSEMGPVEELADAVCLTVRRTGNAFVMPRRAFASDDDIRVVVAAARQWSQPHLAPPPSRSA